MTGISKSTVSKLCKDIDERVHAFLKRPLTGEWPYLWLDATYLKVREGGRIISVRVRQLGFPKGGSPDFLSTRCAQGPEHCRRRRDPPGLPAAPEKTQVWRQVADQFVGPSSAPAWTRPKPTCSPTPASPPSTARSYTQPIRSSGSTRRSSAAPTSSESSRTKTASSASSGLFGAERRVAAPAPIHADRRHGRTQPTHDRGGKSTHHRQSRLTMAHGHSRNYNLDGRDQKNRAF
jgi:hypothetical protein